ncbi:MAG: enoyl-CoA hydratase/isomerase family protein [Phycisphaerales bacterium]|nr:enoyl-CoA hydratase/isomerase family protein [Phycisphaerales bacterium]
MHTLTEQQSLRFEVSDNAIVTLWLDGGGRPVVVLDRHLIQRLNTTLDEIEALTDIKGLMLKSDCERVFVAGADLAEIDALDDHGLHGYLAFGTTVFTRIANLPYPTVALINGAALGGGLEIAMHCQGIIASTTNAKGKPYPIGLPEAGLGICPGWGGTQMLPARIDPAAALQATATGTTFMSNELPEGLCADMVESTGELDNAGLEWLAAQSKPDECIISVNNDAVFANAANVDLEPSEAANAVLLAYKTGVEQGYAAGVSIEQCELVKLRHTPTARQRLEAFLSKG